MGKRKHIIKQTHYIATPSNKPWNLRISSSTISIKSVPAAREELSIVINTLYLLPRPYLNYNTSHTSVPTIQTIERTPVLTIQTDWMYSNPSLLEKKKNIQWKAWKCLFAKADANSTPWYYRSVRYHRCVDKSRKEQLLIDNSPWIGFAEMVFDKMLLRQHWVKQPVVGAFAIQLHSAIRWLAPHLIAWSRPHRRSIYSIHRLLVVLRVRETGLVTKESWLWLLSSSPKDEIDQTRHKSIISITIYHIIFAVLPDCFQDGKYRTWLASSFEFTGLGRRGRRPGLEIVLREVPVGQHDRETHRLQRLLEEICELIVLQWKPFPWWVWWAVGIISTVLLSTDLLAPPAVDLWLTGCFSLFP